ncbi:MAG: hypothetical protein OK456_10480 [Thaumarchaeota archaeon]|nr:hypothetical protein [Nitrososphaerota archaeon]
MDRKRAMAIITLTLFATSGLIPLSALAAGNPDATNLPEFFGVAVLVGSSQNNFPQGAGSTYPPAPGGSGQKPGGFMGLEVGPGLPTGVTIVILGEGGVDAFWVGAAAGTTPPLVPFSQEYYSSQTPGLGPYYASASPSITSAIPGLWLDEFDKKRRTRAQIYVEILELVRGRGPMTPFSIAFYGRLNHKRAKECVDFLKLCGYLQPEEEEDKVAYALTNEGAAFLERAKALFLRQKQFIPVSE